MSASFVISLICNFWSASFVVFHSYFFICSFLSAPLVFFVGFICNFSAASRWLHSSFLHLYCFSFSISSPSFVVSWLHLYFRVGYFCNFSCVHVYVSCVHMYVSCVHVYVSCVHICLLICSCVMSHVFMCMSQVFMYNV